MNGDLNGRNQKLQDYRDAIIAICHKYFIPYIDPSIGLGIHKFNWSLFLVDGTHPNDLGHQRYGEFVAGQLLSL
jgi:lysophospholipase L1-like esterase